MVFQFVLSHDFKVDRAQLNTNLSLGAIHPSLDAIHPSLDAVHTSLDAVHTSLDAVHPSTSLLLLIFPPPTFPSNMVFIIVLCHLS